MRETRTKAFAATGVLAAALLLGACGSTKENTYPEQMGGSEQYDPFGREADAGRGYLLGGDKDGVRLLDIGKDEEEEKKEEEKKKKKKAKAAKPDAVGVNSYLWRATLDTLSFMPLASADPFGGVIITDWYTSPDTPAERFKIQVYILDKRLRADGVRVNIFRQARQVGTGWVDEDVSDDTKIKIENAILQRARELRVRSLPE